MGPFRVKAGEEFAVTLRVNSPANLRGLPLLIHFDPQVLSFIDAQPGDFATRSGLAAFNATVDVPNGLIRVEMRATGEQGFRGQGDLLTLRFTAQTPWKQTQVSIMKNDLTDDSGAVAAAIRSTPLTLRVSG
jgi:general secretion pathway protein D